MDAKEQSENNFESKVAYHQFLLRRQMETALGWMNAALFEKIIAGGLFKKRKIRKMEALYEKHKQIYYTAKAALRTAPTLGDIPPAIEGMALVPVMANESLLLMEEDEDSKRHYEHPEEHKRALYKSDISGFLAHQKEVKAQMAAAKKEGNMEAYEANKKEFEFTSELINETRKESQDLFGSTSF